MSDNGIDVLPNLPNCPVPVIPAVYTGDMPRYVPHRTHPSLYAVQKVPFGLSTEIKVGNKNGVSLDLKEDECISWVDFYANPIPSFIFWSGRKNKSRLCESKQASCCAKSDAEIVLGPFVCLFV